MEFNNKITSSVDNMIGTTTNTNTISTTDNQVVLRSSSGASSKTLDATLLVTTSSIDSNIIVSFSSSDIVAQFNPDNIRSKVLTVYGKNGRLYLTNRDVESISIKPSEFPARVEYNFVTIDDDSNETRYSAVYTIPQFDSTSKITLNSTSTNTVLKTDTNSAITIIDSEVYNIKNNLQKISTFYDNNLKKDVSLQNIITNILTRLDNLTVEINELKEKTKNL